MINILKRVICHNNEGQTFIVLTKDYKKLSKRIKKGENLKDILQVIDYEMQTEDNDINYDNILIKGMVFITDDNQIFDMPSDALDNYFVTKVMKEKGMSESEFIDFQDANLREVLKESGYELVDFEYEALEANGMKLTRIGDVILN